MIRMLLMMTTLPRASRHGVTVVSAASTVASYKDLWVLRHGQALHNPRTEAAREAGCSHDEFLALMRHDDALDAELTALGREQAQHVFATHIIRHFGGKGTTTTLTKNGVQQQKQQPSPLELVVSSPLSRAIQTADLAVPPTLVSNRICYESFREINGWLLNAKRRTVTEIAHTFPHWNLDHMSPPSDEDVLWTPVLETSQACRERGYQGLAWLLRDRPEERIVLVAHGAILKCTLTDHALVKVVDGRRRYRHRQDAAGHDGRSAEERFANGELRRYRMQWEKNSDNLSSEQKGTIVLTEIDLDHDHDHASEMEEELTKRDVL
jgi:broad specificity phosphatase PhoE